MNKVSFTTEDLDISGGRLGTLFAEKSDIVAKFGEPAAVDCGDDKVTMRWCFNTPNGPVEVRDYWWNTANEWSIASETKEAADDVIAYLNSEGFDAGEGMRFKPLQRK